MADASSSNIPPTKGQPWGGRLRRVFWNDLGLRVGWRFVLYLALFFAMAFLSGYVLSPSGNVMPVILGMPVSFLAAFGAALVMCKIERRNADTYGLPWHGAFGRLFWQGCAVGLIEVSVLVGVMAMVHRYSFGPLLVDSRSLVKWGLTCVYLFVAKALFFQFMFRGYTQYTLAEGIGFWSAAEVLSAINAMGSVASGKADFVGLPVLFAVGLLWSLTLRRTRSLWFAVGLQAAFDFGATFLYSVPNLEFGFPLGYHLSQARLHGPVWLTGGTMGVEGSPLRFLTVGILVLLVNKLYPAKAKDAQADNGIEVSAKLDVPAQPKKGYLRSPGWRRDLVFVCVGLALASWPKIRQYLNTDPVSKASDFEKLASPAKT